MDEREKRIVTEVINLLRDEFADDDAEFQNDVALAAVNTLLRLIDPDFDEVPEVSSTAEVMTALSGGPDYIVNGRPGSTIYQVFPQSEPARNFLIVRAGMDALWFGGSLCVEHRYIEDLLNALRADGWKVSGQ